MLYNSCSKTYLRNVFWSFTVDVNKLLKVLRTFEEDDSTSEKNSPINIITNFCLARLSFKATIKKLELLLLW